MVEEAASQSQGVMDATGNTRGTSCPLSDDRLLMFQSSPVNVLEEGGGGGGVSGGPTPALSLRTQLLLP